ncbi:MAG TPA: glycoside hydrolase family 99-like domain-containing protein [Bacillota bacterium]|nr:glycoside hydrolase family 99-like domain-containing protein [Bacillota bacterium]
MKQYILRKAKGGIRRIKQQLRKSGVAPTQVGLPCRYNMDSPTQTSLESKQVTVEGWLIPNEGITVRGIRVVHADRHIDVEYGLLRQDVARAFPDIPEMRSLNSGFSASVDVTDGPLTVEVDLGKGYKLLHGTELRYAPEQMVADLYNPDLATNYAEHLNLMENKKRYFYEDAPEVSYQRHPDDPRLIAFYLPQYHPLKANDLRFGKGFTEWTNVTGATPRFVGHLQPLLPRDFGFYDLRLDDSIKQQIDLAQQHGVYGFCFYYYWFSGNKVLERPLESFLKHKEWDFNFTICWANENWTKQWDGRDKDIFIAQRYLPEDPLNFIKDVEPILLDPRYIREDGKPVLVVYRPLDLKDPHAYVKTWREYFRKKHNLELHLVSVLSFDDHDPREYGFDAAIDFPPQTTFFKNNAYEGGKYPYLDVTDKLIDRNFGGSVADYRKLALNTKQYDILPFDTYKSVMPGWDNDPRQNKRSRGFVCHYVSPDVYGAWLDSVLRLETAKQKAPISFLTAWNEWGEGAVLEPTLFYGRAILNRTTEVLSRYSGNKKNQAAFPLYGINRKPKVKTAVVIHLYYPELWPMVKEKLVCLKDTPHDLFISINLKNEDFTEEIKHYDSHATVVVTPNRGRDVLPFVHLARRLSAAGYEYVLKLHTKKSKHRGDGDQWFGELLNNLLPSAKVVSQVLNTLENTPTVIGPAGHFLSLERYMGSDERHIRRVLGEHVPTSKLDDVLGRPEQYGFFGGTMFWASLRVLQPILDLYLMPEDFESESGQIDGTLAHGIERSMSLLPQLANTPVYASSPKGIKKLSADDAETDYQFAP